jgi:hypothetical protein
VPHITVHGVSPTLFNALPGEVRRGESAIWKTIELPGIVLTVFLDRWEDAGAGAADVPF